MLEKLVANHKYGVAEWGTLLHAFIAFAWLVYFFETYLDVRQHRKFSIKTRPSQLTYVSDEEFKKAQEYGKDKSSFGFITSLWGNIRLTGMFLIAYYPFIWNYSGELMQYFGYSAADHPLVHSAVFFCVDSLIESLLSLPFNFYKIFVIEERHGFNKQTVGLFLSDTIKGFLLTLVIAPPLLSLVIVIIEWGGPHFYLFVGAVLLVIQLLAVPFYSNVIQPCFNKVESLPEGTLRTAIEKLSASINFPLTGLYVIDGSKRSSHSNAYFYGFFKSKRIVLFDTLIKQCNESQVLAVLGHELGHWSLNHTIKNLIVAQLQLLATFYLFGQVIHNRQLYTDFGFHSSQPTYMGLLFFTFVFSPVQHVLNFLHNVLSRKYEFEADAFAANLGYGSDLKQALITLQKENKGMMCPDSMYSAYHHSHPPLLQRLQAIDEQTKDSKKKQ